MKKNSIFIVSVTALISILCLLLLIFCIPSQIPTPLSYNEVITHLGSKWILLILLILMILFMVLSLTFKSKHISIFFKALNFVVIFENVLIFVYFSLESSFVIGELFKIPMSVLTFLPISFLIIVWANLLKNLPYKSKFGIRNKYSKETEFLWTQIHFSAKNIFLAAGMILLLISLIFSLFRQTLIELILFVSVIIISYLLTFKESKMMYTKYLEMKTRKDNLAKQKDEKK